MQTTIAKSTIRRLPAWVALTSLASWLAAPGIANAAPQGLSSAFTYQGYLEFSIGPVNNDTDMRFSLYDEQMGGTPIAGPIVFDGQGTNLDPVDVVNGYFTVTLDFGTNPYYSGNALWLEIEIRQHTNQECQSGFDCSTSGTCVNNLCVYPYYLLEPRTSLTGTPHALGLRYPQTGRAEIDGPMFRMIQSGEGSVLEIESADDVCLAGSSPTFLATNLACGSVAKFLSQTVQFNPDPPPPTLEAQNFSGGVGVSVLLAPHPEATMVNPSVPALAVTNRATGVAALFHIPDPELPIEDGCPPQCPPFPWPWVEEVAPGIDVINQSGGPAGRFSTDSNLLLPAVHVANAGMGMAVQAVNSNALPTLEATNNGGGSAGNFAIYAFNPQPDPPFPVIDIKHHGGGPGGKFEIYAWNPQPDPPGVAIEGINNACGSAANLVSGGFASGGGAATAQIGMCSTSAPTLRATNTGLGQAALLQKVMGPDPDSSPALEVSNVAGGPAAVFSGNIMVTGDVDADGDLRVTGDIQRNYGNGAPSFHRTGPIAYATINQDGTVAAGTPNVSCAWNLPNQRYEITITGETYSTTAYVTTVTPVAIAPADTLFANTSSGLGQLRVRILSTTTGAVGQQKPFHFIVYKP